MPNLEFHYFYRDGGNYKTFGSVVLSNPDGLSLKAFELKIKEQLIDGEYFYANKWGFADLRPSTFNADCDPSWHEFEKIEFTPEIANHLYNFEGNIVKITVR